MLGHAAASPSPRMLAPTPAPAPLESSQVSDAICEMEDDPACEAEDRERARQIAASQEEQEEFAKHINVLIEFNRLTKEKQPTSDELLAKVKESLNYYQSHLTPERSDKYKFVKPLQTLLLTLESFSQQEKYKKEQIAKALESVNKMIEKFKGTDSITVQEMEDLQYNLNILRTNRHSEYKKLYEEIKSEFYKYGLRNQLQTIIPQLNRSLIEDIKTADTGARKIRATSAKLATLSLANQGPLSRELVEYTPKQLSKMVALLAYEKAIADFETCDSINDCDKTLLARKILRLRDNLTLDRGIVVVDAESDKVKLALYWLNYFKDAIKDSAFVEPIDNYNALETYRICQLRVDKGVKKIIQPGINIPNRLHSLVTTNKAMAAILKLTRELKVLRPVLKVKLNDSQEMATEEHPDEGEKEELLNSKCKELLKINVKQDDIDLFNNSKLFLRKVMKLAVETDTARLVDIGLVDCRGFFDPTNPFQNVLDEPSLAAANNGIAARLAQALAPRRTLTQTVDRTVKAAGAGHFCPFYLEYPLITGMIEDCAELQQAVEMTNYAKEILRTEQLEQQKAFARQQAQALAQAQRQQAEALYNRIGAARQALLVQTVAGNPVPRLAVFYNAIIAAGRQPANDAELAAIATGALGLSPQLPEHATAVKAMKELIITGYLSRLLSRVNPASLSDTDPMKRFLIEDSVLSAQIQEYLARTSPAGFAGGKRKAKSRHHKKRSSRKYRFIRKTRRNRK